MKLKIFMASLAGLLVAMELIPPVASAMEQDPSEQSERARRRAQVLEAAERRARALQQPTADADVVTEDFAVTPGAFGSQVPGLGSLAVHEEPSDDEESLREAIAMSLGAVGDLSLAARDLSAVALVPSMPTVVDQEEGAAYLEPSAASAGWPGQRPLAPRDLSVLSEEEQVQRAMDESMGLPLAPVHNIGQEQTRQPDAPYEDILVPQGPVHANAQTLELLSHIRAQGRHEVVKEYERVTSLIAESLSAEAEVDALNASAIQDALLLDVRADMRRAAQELGVQGIDFLGDEGLLEAIEAAHFTQVIIPMLRSEMQFTLGLREEEIVRIMGDLEIQ